MFDRNALAHKALWPNGKKSVMALIDDGGEVVAEVPLDRLTLGSEVARYLPDGWSVDFAHTVVTSMSGRPIVKTVAPFDTAVITERAEVGFEERMQRLERKERRREQREQQLRREKEALEKRLAEAEAVVEPQEATKEPEATQEATKEPEATAEPPEKGGEA